MSYLCTVLGNLNEWHIQFSLPIRRTYRLFYKYYSFPDESVLVQKTENFVIHLDYCTFKILQLKISRIIPNQRSFFSLSRNLSFARYNVFCKESSIIFRIFLTLLAFPFVQKRYVPFVFYAKLSRNFTIIRAFTTFSVTQKFPIAGEAIKGFRRKKRKLECSQRKSDDDVKERRRDLIKGE